MRFNKFIWQVYAQSKQGRKAIKKFSNLTDSFVEPWCRTFDFEFYDEFKEQYPVKVAAIDIPKLVQDAVSGRKFSSFKTANRYYERTVVPKGIPFKMTDRKGRTNVVFIFGEEVEHWYDYIAAVSLGLYRSQPDYFLPYDFRCRFNQLEEIHAEFNIPLPQIPGEFKKEERSLYYLSINQTWQEFRHLQGLSPAEMCAFLYDFAPEFITPMDASDLPSPSKVWLVTGGSWDFDAVDGATADTVSRWGGSPAIRRGDIVMMYLVTPYRYIHSIWRACSDGFLDPFFHYYRAVWICGRIKTMPVTYAELKEHPLLSNKPALRAHFQGPSGKAPFTVEEYESVLQIMKRKGQDLSVLPRLRRDDHPSELELRNERDVEVQMIEPFLKRLGYKEIDWIRQMPVRMGRGERNYPDYAVGAIAKVGAESARMVLESKYQLSAHRDFVDSFYQAKSYALRLQARIMVMAAKEGVWAFPPADGSFDLKRVVHKTWGELNHPDAFHEIRRLIGRDEVLQKKVGRKRS